MGRDRERVLVIGKMDNNIKDNGRTTKNMEMDTGKQKIQTPIQVNGNRTMPMALAFIKRIMVRYMKESLKSSKNMEKENKHSQMEIVFREITQKDKQVERVNIHGVMV